MVLEFTSISVENVSNMLNSIITRNRRQFKNVNRTLLQIILVNLCNFWEFLFWKFGKFYLSSIHLTSFRAYIKVLLGFDWRSFGRNCIGTWIFVFGLNSPRLLSIKGHFHCFSAVISRNLSKNFQRFMYSKNSGLPGLLHFGKFSEICCIFLK